MFLIRVRHVSRFGSSPCASVLFIVRAAMPDVFNEITSASLVHIRKTSETPPRVSVLDVIGVLAGTSPTECSHTLSRLKERFPEVGSNMSNFKFPGQGQRETPVAAATVATPVRSNRSNCRRQLDQIGLTAMALMPTWF